MRRLIALATVVAVLALVPAPVMAARERCSIDVVPAAGGPTDTYRIIGSNFPLAPDGGSLEVRIDIHRVGSREGSILFLFLVPGGTEFYVDYNAAEPGEPSAPLAEGRYLVRADTPHVRGCHTTDRFVVSVG